MKKEDIGNTNEIELFCYASLIITKLNLGKKY